MGAGGAGGEAVVGRGEGGAPAAGCVSPAVLLTRHHATLNESWGADSNGTANNKTKTKTKEFV